MWRKGRKKAEKYRFFLRSPYHHHLQRLWTYSEKEQDVVSVWVILLNKLGFNPVPEKPFIKLRTIYLLKYKMMARGYLRMNMITYLNHFIKLIKGELTQNQVLVWDCLLLQI